MATTQIADIIVPEIFNPYVDIQSTETNAFWQSGIVVSDAEFNRLAQEGGHTGNMPFFNDLDNATESNVGSDDPGVLCTHKKITSGKDVYRKHFRNNSWSSADLAAACAGADPMRAIGDKVSGYWSREYQRILIASLDGLFADNVANDSSDMVITIGTDAAGAPTDAELIGSTAIIDAQQTMGDRSAEFAVIAMHSVPYGRLRKLNLIDFIPDSTNAAAALIPTYLGMRVIVDDQCPAVAGVNRILYTTYLFAQGAIAFGRGTPRVPSEVEREACGGNGEGIENLHSRQHFILHPRGIAWQEASVAGAGPTNAELADATNWDRVYDRKLVRVASLVTNG